MRILLSVSQLLISEMELSLTGGHPLTKSYSKDSIRSATRLLPRVNSDLMERKKLVSTFDVSGSSPCRSESLFSVSGVELGRGGGSEKKGGTTTGVICGEASCHYLIRSNSTWIPISKKSLFSSKGDPLPPLPLKDLKFKRVLLLNLTTSTPQAHLLDESPDNVMILRVDSEGQVDRDCETDIGVSDEDARALELQTSLAADLFTDITAMTALRTDQTRSLKYISNRAPRIKKSIDTAFAAIKGIDAHLYANARPICMTLFANLDLLTSESGVVCAGCRAKEARVGLSCGHKMCVDCGNQLVCFSSNMDAKLKSCPVCHHELTLTDGKLILLEKYQDLKRSDPRSPVA